MTMPASAEFVALCQSQVAVLTESLGAAWSYVYLTEPLARGENTKLIPLVVYPETAMVWKNETNDVEEQRNTTPEVSAEIEHHLAKSNLETISLSSSSLLPRDSILSSSFGLSPLPRADQSSKAQRQIVLPLLDQEVVIGLLVTGRQDRQWNKRERKTIEHIAHTLAIACVIDRQRAWLDQQLNQQKRVDMAQRDLLDNLLHQFRNPLTALRTFSKLLMRRLLPEDANRNVATSIVRETERLQELLQQFDLAMDFNSVDEPLLLRPVTPLPSSLQSAPLPLLPATTSALSIQSCSTTEVLAPLVDVARAIALERNLDLTTIIPPNLPPVKGNPQALVEIISNLIDNALKYTPAAGKVVIEAGLHRNAQTGNFQGIAISNTGAGIPPQDLEHIFERHYRGIQTETGIPGSGLGLAIAKDLVMRMGGEIEVFSPAKYHWTEHNICINSAGTTFIVWLPY